MIDQQLTKQIIMLKFLGARLSADNLQAYFPHPCDANAKVYIFLMLVT